MPRKSKKINIYSIQNYGRGWWTTFVYKETMKLKENFYIFSKKVIDKYAVLFYFYFF